MFAPHGYAPQKLDEEPGYGNGHVEDGNDYRRLEKEFLRASALIERRREIVASKGSSEAGSTILEHDAYDQEKGEDRFCVRQYCQ